MYRSVWFYLRFLSLFMGRMLSAPFAEFFEFQLALNFAEIFVAPVVESFALGTLHPDEIILWHSRFLFCTLISMFYFLFWSRWSGLNRRPTPSFLPPFRLYRRIRLYLKPNSL